MSKVERRLKKAAGQIGRRVLEATLCSNEAATAATLQTLDELHTAHTDIHIGDVKDAVRIWLTKWPWRLRRATTVDTDASRYFLGT